PLRHSCNFRQLLLGTANRIDFVGYLAKPLGFPAWNLIAARRCCRFGRGLRIAAPRKRLCDP
ncbi:MAG: hypothetical protein E6575_05000, partial [Bradyrhizobium sp.]|nr:hypothetical protein [Bradyrhizobium sp.]